MIQLEDQLGRNVVLKQTPTRIISLVPSQTELLHDLGLEEEVIGITKFCVHPKKWYESKNRIGGTKNLSFDKIKELSPDLIIANKEENTKEDIEHLSKKYNVYVSDVNSFEEALGMISDLGKLIGREKQARELINTIIKEKENYSPSKIRSAVYFIWREPWMVVGRSTFINSMVQLAGYENLISDERYPELKLEDLKALNPDVVLLSTEPYPFKEVHVMGLKELLPNTSVKLVDGEYFSWYGSRMKDAFSYFTLL